MDSMIAFKWNTSFHLAHKLQCLSALHFLIYSLAHLIFHAYAYFHIPGPCHCLQLEVASLCSVLLTQNPNFLLTGFLHTSKTPKKCRNSRLSSLHHSEELRTLCEFSQRHHLGLPIEIGSLLFSCHGGHEAMMNTDFLRKFVVSQG